MMTKPQANMANAQTHLCDCILRQRLAQIHVGACLVAAEAQ